MKILFICGALEQGKDGVGDYTRRLAGELIRQGHHAAIIAYNDRHIETMIDGEQADEDTGISILRLPAALNANDKVKLSRNYVVGFQPDWISLQFVIYSFHPKGLPFFLARQLRQVGQGYKWFIMFHELWIELNSSKTSLKNRILRWIQKDIIHKLINRLRVERLYTSISIYQQQLNAYGCIILPLFGNIPLVEKIPDPVSNGYFRAVHFGNFSEHMDDFKNQVIWLKKAADRHKSRLLFITLGIGGAYKKHAFQLLKEQEVEVLDIGISDNSTISKHLFQADIGVSRADYSLFGKSGSTLAMIEHGLPVLLRGSRKLAILEKNKFYFFNDKPLNITRATPYSGLERTAIFLYETMGAKNWNITNE